MNEVTSTIIAASFIINIITLVIVAVNYIGNVKNVLYVQQLHTGMTSILARILALEATTTKIGNSFTDFINTTGDMIDKLMMMNSSNRMNPLYKTVDGKFTATSIDELIDKIKQSGSESKYFNEDEIDKLKKMFEDNDDYLDEDDESDQPPFNK